MEVKQRDTLLTEMSLVSSSSSATSIASRGECFTYHFIEPHQQKDKEKKRKEKKREKKRKKIRKELSQKENFE